MERIFTRGIYEIETEKSESKRIEINLERVAVWTLIFTNAFFVSYFFAILFKLV